MKDRRLQKCFSSSWAALFLFSAIIMMPFSPETTGAAGWKAGTAAVVVTPQKPVNMSGYPLPRPEIGYQKFGDRISKSTGKIGDLYVKALALEDPQGNRAVIMTADLSSINTNIGTRVKNEIQRKYGISSKAILLNASHTHCGPSYGGSGQGDNDLTDWMEQRFLEVIGKAVESLKPSELTFSKVRPIQRSPGSGSRASAISYSDESFWAPFAVSRRLPTPEGIVRNYPQVLGDVYTGGDRDNTVPVLRVAGPDGAIKAILFGYACHPTSMIGTLLCAEYPGFAQSYIEEAYPGANAMFAQGCSGNLTPAMKFYVEYAEGNGRALADAVKSALDSDQQPITGTIRFDSDVVQIDMRPDSGREELVRSLPVQVLRIGNEVLIIGLPGEPVVEYAVRFKSEFLTQFTWVMGYCGSFGYLPTWRILKEGGYEARTPFAETVESKVVEVVRRLVNNVMKDKNLQ